MTLSTTVPGYGTTPNDIMVVGEAPGQQEARANPPRPFVGPAGDEQLQYLRPYGLTPKLWYNTNVNKTYTVGNPDPTNEQISQWTQTLIDEVVACQPKLIIAVGGFATRWFLGDRKKMMRTVHGRVCNAGCFDPSISHRACGAIILPVNHPARGLHDFDSRGVIWWDYKQVAKAVDMLNRYDGTTVSPMRRMAIPVDEHAGKENYYERTGQHIANLLGSRALHGNTMGLDTEGTPGNPWSIQISFAAGHGLVLRQSTNDFNTGIEALQRYIDTGALIVLHNAITPSGSMYDITMARAMGLDLTHANIFDTMLASYLLRIEPWGLGDLSYRHCGTLCREYNEVLATHGSQKQIDYLCKIYDLELPRPDKVTVRENNGEKKSYHPMSLSSKAKKIILDWSNNKLDKDGDPIDIVDRWTSDSATGRERKDYLRDNRLKLEHAHGAIPMATFDDVPLSESIPYAARDADVTLRLYPILQRLLVAAGVEHLMAPGIEVLKILEGYKHVGVPASRKYFALLDQRLSNEMIDIQQQISDTYLDGASFNPDSSPDTAKLLEARGLTSGKRTPTGQVSTGKAAIEKYRYTDDAIALLFGSRERSKYRSTYCAHVLQQIPDDVDIATVHRPIHMNTHTRRMSGDLLTLPVRQRHGAEEGFGLLIRNGYVCPPGYKFGSWDFSGWEYRILAHRSQDPLLLKYFREGQDPHAETALRMFDIPIKDQDPTLHRLPAKTTNFGIIYGQYGSGLLTEFEKVGLRGWTVSKTNALVDTWYGIHPGVVAYKERVEQQLIDDPEHIMRDHWGMMRRLPGIVSNDHHIRAETLRKAVSQDIQGTAQGAIQNSMIWLRPNIEILNANGYEIHPCLQIHDELMLWYRDDPGVFELLNALVTSAMVDHCGIVLRVPIKVDGHRSDNWGGLK